MLDFLLSRFVRGYEDINHPDVRLRCGRFSGGIGIFLNLLLFAGKFAVGLLTSSIAITADAFNNLSDAASSVITLFGFHLAGKRADNDHPFGHGRMEYLSGLAVSLLILLAGLEVGKASFKKILHPEEVLFSAVSVAILTLSICIKLWMFLFNRKLGKRIGSPAMAAVAADSLSDAAATAAVLLSSLAGHFWSLNIDAWAGLLVAVLILRAGWGAAKDTLNPLLGKRPDLQLVRDIRSVVLSHREITGMHDLAIHDYGPGRTVMSLHAEVRADGDLMALHDVIDGIERELKERFGIETCIHADPLADDALTVRMREQTAALVRELDERMTIHDFRMISGPLHTNLIFDVVVPYECGLSDREVEHAIQKMVRDMEGGPYFAVLQVDHAHI